MKVLHSLWKGLFGQAYLLLILTTLFWGGNAIAGRVAVGEVSPMVLTSLRWGIVLAIMVATTGSKLVSEWPQLKGHLLSLLLMGGFGFTGFNALLYAAAYHTTAVNITIFQGAIPVLVLFGAALFFRSRIGLLQILGMITTLAGVVIVSIKGDIHIFKTFALNIGDVWMLIACVFYAGYTLGLRHRPAVSGLVFFTALAACAALTSLPPLAYEIATGTVQWPTPKGWLVLIYIALLPSLLSQVFFIRGVELIGPARAGLFVNLVPVFGALLAVVLLGEPFASYHLLGLMLVLGGIWLAERRR